MTGKFHPRYASQEHIYLVDMISEVLRNSKGRRRGEIEELLKEVEAYGDYRVVRGFYDVLLAHCTFEQEIGLNPRPLRDFAFSRMSEIGHYNLKTAAQVVSEGAIKFGVSPGDFRDAMWSDLPQNAVLKDFREPNPSEVILEYNFRAVSSLLLKSTYLKFWVSDRWKDALWAVKRLGLMYQLDDSSITVDGPASLMRNTRAYGLGISRLFYFITKAKKWWIEAGIGSRVLVASSDDPILSGSGEITFDSDVERRFYQDFVSLKTGWDIKREPEPLRAGSYTFIPDFLFEKGGIRVYMEIVGFWTAEYLERKFRKLKELKVDNMIVAIDSSSSKGKVPEIHGNVFTYKKTPDVYKVRGILMQLEKPLRDKMLEMAMALEVDGDVVSVKKMALDNGLPEDIIKEAITKKMPEGYIFDGANLISPGKAETLRNEITGLNKADANSAVDFLIRAGIDASISTLIALGFIIEWHGLEAKIKF
ncbi:MAG: DUF790 family protein [Nitrososphaerota archaeon]|nr:DUF790 family protein [Nitrososphaerota archaeon]MDG6931191.1 DUF790 family protein [Nitrososphaerota archaeon]